MTTGYFDKRPRIGVWEAEETTSANSSDWKTWERLSVCNFPDLRTLGLSDLFVWKVVFPSDNVDTSITTRRGHRGPLSHYMLSVTIEGFRTRIRPFPGVH